MTSDVPSRPANEERRSWPLLKVTFTAVVGAAGIVSSDVGLRLVDPLSLAWGLAGPVLGLVALALSLLITAARPMRALVGSAKLLSRWSHLPAHAEPLPWMLLVVLAEEGVFRLAAFSWLPSTWWSVCLVSLVFVGIHLPRLLQRQRPLRIASATFFLSVVLCLAYLWSGSFWLVVGAHLAHNLALDKLRQSLATGRAAASSGDEGGDR